MAVTPGTSRRPDDKGKLTAEARHPLEMARDQMPRGEYATHEEIVARYR
jgi:hypothetical protein